MNGFTIWGNDGSGITFMCEHIPDLINTLQKLYDGKYTEVNTINEDGK